MVEDDGVYGEVALLIAECLPGNQSNRIAKNIAQLPKLPFFVCYLNFSQGRCANYSSLFSYSDIKGVAKYYAVVVWSKILVPKIAHY